MAVKYTYIATLLFLTATLLAFGEANTDFTKVTQNPNYGYNFTAGWPRHFHNATQKSRRIVVGGDQKWRFGFNYTNWAIKNGPFYINDTLVFKFDPPSNTTFPHNVYLLRNYQSFLNCNLKRAQKVAEVTQGGGKGFEFVIKKWKPHYFACGVRNGFHCNVGLMKFAVTPFLRWK